MICDAAAGSRRMPVQRPNNDAARLKILAIRNSLKGDRDCYRTCRGGGFNLIRVLAGSGRRINLTGMAKPVIRSIHEFGDYTAQHLTYARVMRKLSRDDEY